MAILPGARLRSNSIFGTITDDPLTIGATTFNSVGLALLGVVSGNHAIVTLDPLKVNGNPEIVMITAHTGSATVATIQRGMFGTSAREHPSETMWVHAAIDDDFTEVLTSSTRPSDQYKGQTIFETDTNSLVTRDTTDTWYTAIPFGAWTSWTPSVTQQVTSVTSTINRARYTRVGSVVHVFGDINCTSAGSAGGQIIIGGFPVPFVATGGGNYAITGSGYFIDSSALEDFPYIIRSNASTTVVFQDSTIKDILLGVTGSAFAGALASGDRIVFSAVYEAG